MEQVNKGCSSPGSDIVIRCERCAGTAVDVSEGGNSCAHTCCTCGFKGHHYIVTAETRARLELANAIESDDWYPVPPARKEPT